MGQSSLSDSSRRKSRDFDRPRPLRSIFCEPNLTQNTTLRHARYSLLQLMDVRRIVSYRVLSTVSSMAAFACPETERLKKTTIPTYDNKTGKLTQLTYDRNKNGKIDTWTDMDGTRALRSRIDLDEDGKIDRWEYYDDKGGVVKVGFSRMQDGREDAWGYSTQAGRRARGAIPPTGRGNK